MVREAMPRSDLQKTIGRFQCVDLCQAHLLDQPVLQRAEEPLDAPFGLRRMRGDPLDIQFISCA
jgi:hypothetical protein